MIAIDSKSRFGAALVALTVFFAGNADANTVSGNDLFTACTTQNDAGMANFCAAYVIGVIEGMKMGLAWPMMTSGEMTTAEVNTTVEAVLQICAAPEVEYGQHVGVAIKYLSDHPEARHKSARFLIMESLQAAFPCGK